MKVLWLSNMMLPMIAEQLSLPYSNGGGWLTGLAEDLNNIDDIELTIVFPIIERGRLISGNCKSIKYYGFPRKITDPTKYDDVVENYFKKILLDINPDIVHIFGTEFPHTLSMVKAFGNPDKTIINIQGLCSIISKHYLTGIPSKYYNKYTFRDFIKKDNLLQQKEKFSKRGKFEIEAVKAVNNIIGRTTWDKACIKQINNNVKYHFCNETLRSAFYEGEWDIEKCEKFSIFVSQANYPVKGLHLLLKAMPEVIKNYPKTRVYIAGNDITKIEGIKDKLRISFYAKYIKKLIKKNNLTGHIVFTGNLTEKQMKEKLLNSHIFVSPSIIENSPNSLGEAMLLGVPSVAANVGGVSDMLLDKSEGFLYQCDAPYMLSHYINEIFKNNELAKKFSENGKKHARETHNREKNLSQMLKIYNSIYEENKK